MKEVITESSLLNADKVGLCMIRISGAQRGGGKTPPRAEIQAKGALAPPEQAKD